MESFLERIGLILVFFVGLSLTYEDNIVGEALGYLICHLSMAALLLHIVLTVLIEDDQNDE